MERKRRCQRGPLLHCPVMWRTQHAAVHGSATPQTPHPAPIIRRQRPRTYVTPTQLRLPAPTGYAGTPATPAGRVSARTTRCRPVQPSASQRHRRWRRHGTEGRSRERHAHTHTHSPHNIAATHQYQRLAKQPCNRPRQIAVVGVDPLPCALSGRYSVGPMVQFGSAHVLYLLCVPASIQDCIH
jgi:hypothetical protein